MSPLVERTDMTDELVRMAIHHRHYMEQPFPTDEIDESEMRWMRDVLENDLGRYVNELRDTLEEFSPDDEEHRMTKMVLDAILFECGKTYDLDFPVTIYATVKVRAVSQSDAMSIARGLWYNEDFLNKRVIPQYSLDDITVDEPSAYALGGEPTMGCDEVARYL